MNTEGPSWWPGIFKRCCQLCWRASGGGQEKERGLGNYWLLSQKTCQQSGHSQVIWRCLTGNAVVQKSKQIDGCGWIPSCLSHSSHVVYGRDDFPQETSQVKIRRKHLAVWPEAGLLSMYLTYSCDLKIDNPVRDKIASLLYKRRQKSLLGLNKFPMIIQQASGRTKMSLGSMNTFPIKGRFMTYEKMINYSQKKTLFYKHMFPCLFLIFL